MYSAPYGYPNAAAGPIFNGAPPQGAHLQPGPSPNQPQQQMMYNTQQQYPMPGQPAGAFPAGPNPALMGGGGAGPAGMMQNPAMGHMAANGQMAFQAPYTSSPYMAGIPSSSAPQPQLPANFMMAGQMGPYQMNAGLPNQQPMMQRMRQSQQNPAGLSVSTPQRQFSGSQGTPTSSMPPQQQFSTPQAQGTSQSQTPTTAQHPPASIATPQTPTFPTDQGQPQVNGTSSNSAPQSPASEARDRERMAVLLEINQELLYESIQLVNSRNELKKEQAAIEAGGPKNGDLDYAEEEKIANQDYNQCMRRLQANLTYMFALADRKGKPQLPSSPAYMTPPPLSLQLKLKLPPNNPDDPVEMPADPVADRVERDQLMRNLYKRLQSLYPGVDPRKEPPNQPPVTAGGGVKPGQPNAGAGAAVGGGGAKGQNGMGNGQGMGNGTGNPQSASTPVTGGGGAGQGTSENNSPAPTPGALGQGQAQGTPLIANAIAPGLLMQQQRGQH